jgi:hypothetical protein
MKESAFGIFIFSPNVLATRGDSQQLVPVANVIFEAGLFTGMKGRECAILLLPEKSDVAPSDLGGIKGVQYDHDNFDSNKRYKENEPVIWDACIEVTDHIRDVMARQPPSQPSSVSRSAPDTGEAPADAGRAQLNSPLEVLDVTLRADAIRNRLRRLRDTDVERWTLVVHRKHGVGEVVAFDPPGQQPRYVTVRFGSSSGVFDMAELYIAPMSAPEGAD